MVELGLAFFVRRNAFLRAKFMLTTFQKCVHDWDLDWYRNGSAEPVFQVCFWHVSTYFVWYSEVLYSVIPFGNLPWQTRVTTLAGPPFEGLLCTVRKEFHLTSWKVSKYEVFSGPYFPVFSPDTGKYGPEKFPYFDSFRIVFGGIYCKSN